MSRVIDPKIGIDVVSLGLVYGVEVRDDVAHITHTLTTRGCPMERYVARTRCGARALEVELICGVETRVVWEPSWHPGIIASDTW